VFSIYLVEWTIHLNLSAAMTTMIMEDVYTATAEEDLTTRQRPTVERPNGLEMMKNNKYTLTIR
jgi:hypothetical protein